MDWLNLHISTIDSPEATLCDPVRRATWIWLLRFCIGQENGGRIEKCGAWGDTTWQQMARVRLREVRLESTLWHWEDEALVVHFYPVEKEAEVRLNREHGRRGGRPKLRAENNHPVNHPVIESETDRFDSAETEGNGREGKGIGKEENTRALAGAAQAPIDLPERLREAWREIMALDGPEVANAALIAGRRLFRSPSPAQLLETWKCAAAQGRLQAHPDQWPDFRLAMRADQRRDRAPGAVQADAETLEIARQWDAQDRQGAKP